MTSPVQPNLDPSMPPVSSPLGQGNVDDEVRQLAAALAPESVTAMSAVKATVDSISLGDASTPPTIQINLGGILIPNIALAANYSPVVGDTVVLAHQGNSYVALTKIQDKGTAVANSTDGGFTKATLDSGHSHGGNSNGDLMYRRVLDNGAWKVQWQGSFSLGGSDTIISGANALPSDFRPKSRRTLLGARDATNTVHVKIDFNTDGTVAVVQPELSTSSAGSHSHSLGSSDVRLSGYLSQGGSDLGHLHGLGTSSTDGSHSHGVARPSYVTVHLEYFL